MPDLGGESLTSGQREAIERQARIGGGISRNQTLMLLNHIDRLTDLLNLVYSEGPEWDDEQWSVAWDAAMPLVDMWSVRTSAKIGRLAKQGLDNIA